MNLGRHGIGHGHRVPAGGRDRRAEGPATEAPRRTVDESPVHGTKVRQVAHQSFGTSSCKSYCIGREHSRRMPGLPDGCRFEQLDGGILPHDDQIHLNGR